MRLAPTLSHAPSPTSVARYSFRRRRRLAIIIGPSEKDAPSHRDQLLSGPGSGVQVSVEQTIARPWRLTRNVNLFRTNLEAFETMPFPTARPFSFEASTTNTWDVTVNNRLQLPRIPELQVNYIYYGARAVPQRRAARSLVADLSAKSPLMNERAELLFTVTDVYQRLRPEAGGERERVPRVVREPSRDTGRQTDAARPLLKATAGHNPPVLRSGTAIQDHVGTINRLRESSRTVSRQLRSAGEATGWRRSLSRQTACSLPSERQRSRPLNACARCARHTHRQRGLCRT